MARQCSLGDTWHGRVLGSPGSQLIIHDIVGGIFTKRGQAQFNGTQYAVLIGPAVGGATMLLFGAPAGLFINVFMYVPMIVSCFSCPIPVMAR